MSGPGTARGPRSWPRIAVLVTGTFASTLANTLVTVPLPVIVADLGASLSQGVLVVVAFNVACAVMLPLAGWLGDRFGPGRIFLVAMAGVAGGAAGAALAPDLAALVVYRAAQGVSGALVLPTVLALLVQCAGPGRRGRAVAWWAAANGAGQAAGPALGGLVTELLGWRAVFAVLLPFAVGAFVAALRAVPRAPGRPLRLDVPGALALSVAVAALLVAAAAVPPLGTGSTVVRAAAAAGLLASAGFVLVERKCPEPFVPLPLLRDGKFVRSSVAAACQMGCLTATLLVVPLHLHARSGTTPAAAGMMVLSLPLSMTLLAPVAGWLVERWNPRWALRAGLLALAAAEAGLTVVLHAGVTAGFPLVAAVAAVGAGAAFTQTPAAAGGMRSACGVGAGVGVFSQLRFVGAAVGGTAVAVLVGDTATATHALVTACCAAAALGALLVTAFGR